LYGNRKELSLDLQSIMRSGGHLLGSY